MICECKSRSGAAYVDVFLDIIGDCSERQTNGGICAFVHNLSTFVVDRMAAMICSFSDWCIR